MIVGNDTKVKQSFSECVAAVFSAVMEEEVTPQQAVAILHLIASLSLLVFPVAMPVVMRIISFAWFGVSIWLCKKNTIIS